MIVMIQKRNMMTIMSDDDNDNIGNVDYDETTLVICHYNDEDFACSCGEAFYLKPIHLKQSKLEVNIRVVLIFSSLPQVRTIKV